MSESLDIILSFLTLTLLEVVLGIDNLVFLIVISQRLPKHKQKRARQIGLTLAWIMRLILLASVVWLTKLTRPLFHLFGLAFSGRDIFLFGGGMFLLAKVTQEIHSALEPKRSKKLIKGGAQFSWVVAQIGLLDIIFSLDSVLTAIGLTQRFWLMAVAISIAIVAMIFASEPLNGFIERHPTIRMLAMSFLLLIGVFLVADSFGLHIPRGYLYFAIGFSLLVEFLNQLIQRKKRG